MATVTFYSGAGDGGVRNYGFTSFSAIRGAATGDVAYPTSTTSGVSYGVTSGNGGNPGGGLAVARQFLPFDTSTGPASATVTGITLNLYLTAVNDDAPTESESVMHVVANTQASDTTLTTADFDAIGATSFGSVDLGSLTVNQFNVFSVDATGRNEYSDSGYTKYVLREGHDLDAVWPSFSGTWPSSGIDFRTSEYSGTSSDPYIEITYALPPTLTGISSVTGLSSITI